VTRKKPARRRKPARAGPRVLLFDIETSPLLAYVWGLFENNVALNQIHTDWHVLSWAAKWLDAPATDVMYRDQRAAKNIEDDRAILKALWKLLDEADIVVTQNGKAFDQKKLNARFAIHGFQPPSSFKHIDTLKLAKKHFGFTSNRLEYLTAKLNKKYKKLKHEKFAGFELWKACLAGDRAAWLEMEKYNKHDVLALEELYHKLVPWDSTVNFSLYHEGTDHVCKCGSREFMKRGFHYTATGKFQCYRCKKCGAETRDRVNLFDEEKRASLRASTTR
jgi:DNA polymerase elongation subunit (family B)